MRATASGNAVAIGGGMRGSWKPPRDDSEFDGEVSGWFLGWGVGLRALSASPASKAQEQRDEPWRGDGASSRCLWGVGN